MKPSETTIGIASDHAGFRTKGIVRTHLEAQGYTVRDFGSDSEEPVDYPDYIRAAARAVADRTVTCGIVFGGSGNGEAIAANKIRGIRCAVCWSIESARLAKEHNDANVIAIGQRLVAEDVAIAIVDTWLAAEFQGGRHERRIRKIEPD